MLSPKLLRSGGRSTGGWLAVGQLCSTKDVENNFRLCAELVDRAKQRNCSLLCLPEAFDFVGEAQPDALAMAQPLDGPLMSRYCDLAKKNGIWLSLGGFHEKIEGDAEHIFNSHVIVDDVGSIRSVYRKVHLFDINIPNGPCIQESKTTQKGSYLTSVDTPVGHLGLSVCYDLRFPELFLAYRKHTETQILLVPAAFTSTTGRAHWEPLLRARAIETQCYVAAAAQVGKHNSRRESYGHAMIIDPWGEVVASCGDKELSIAVAEIDLGYLDKIRANMPVCSHRRPDVYGSIQYNSSS